MNRYDDIVGQEHIKEHFKSAVAHGTVSHAYIINGEKSSGKMMLARQFALSLMCEKGGAEPCLECDSCRKVISGKHPDIIYFVKDKTKKTGVIDVAGMREQVVNSMYQKPLDGRRKIYIIDDADKMNTKAQNALLKTLEEPPGYGVMLLLTKSCESLLPTILSRCIILNMRPVEDRLIKQYLLDNVKIVESLADVAVKMSGGNVGRARLIAEGSDFFRFLSDVVSILKAIPDADVSSILEFVNTVVSYTKKKDGEEGVVFTSDEMFEIFMLWYRDVLIFKSVGDTERLTFKEDISHISRQSELFTYDALNNVLMQIDEAKSRITSNVSFETVMELLFIKIMEMSKW